MSILLLSFFILIGAASSSDVISRVLNANSRNDIYGSANPTMDDRRYVWAISDTLIKIILKNPNNQEAWEALHKFRNFTDAGLTTMYNDACFTAIKANSLLFYNRYISGDDMALERAKNATWGTDSYEGDMSSTVKANLELLNNITKQLKALNQNDKRHLKFIEAFEASINEVVAEINHITRRSSETRLKVAPGR